MVFSMKISLFEDPFSWPKSKAFGFFAKFKFGVS